jgi:hypothetical protein
METDLSKGILEKIKKEGIKPKSKWHFMLQDYVVWFVFALSIILGSLAFSIMLHFWGINDWDAYYRINNNLLEFALTTMPYFWLAGFVVFLVLGYHYLKHTKSGYRYEFVKIVALNLSLTFICGCILYSFGAGKQFENEFAKHAPFYKDMRDQQQNVWLRPENGVIVGRVIRIETDGDTFELDDPRRVVWTVDASKAVTFNGYMIKEGYMVKVFGIAGEGYFFTAQEIRPLLRDREPRLPFLPGGGMDD